MYPRLFTIPWLGIPVNTYGFMIMLGFLAAVWAAVRNGKKEGVEKDFLIDFGIFLMVVGFLGAKLAFMLTTPGDPNDPRHPWAIFDVSDGTLEWLGAVVLGPMPFVAYAAYRSQSEGLRKGLWGGFGLVLLSTIVVGILTWKAGEETQPEWARWVILLVAFDLAILTGLGAAAGSRGQPWRLASGRTMLLLLVTLVATVYGARAAALSSRVGEYQWDFFTRWQSGFVLYGGLLAAVVPGILYLKWHGQSASKVMDVTAGPIALGIAFGRVGCFFAGCCFGAQAPGWICAVSYPKDSMVWQAQRDAGLIGDNAPESLLVHPTQLYETLAMVVLFFLVQAVFRKKKWQGQAFAALAIGYSVWRFLLEFVRGDERTTWGALYISQWGSLLVLVLAVGWWAWAMARARRAAETPAGA